MNTKTKAEVAPAQSGQPFITLHKGGTKEKTIPLSQLDIPDLWHIAQAEMDLHCRESILRCWHYAHDLKRTVEELADDKVELLAALRDMVEPYSEQDNCWQVERARSAIAKAERGKL